MTDAIFIGARRAVRAGAAAALLAAVALAMPAAAAALLADMSVSSGWAVGGNCRSPHSYYTLEVGDGFIRWQNGEGNIDIERIDYTFDDEFHTTTVRSDHVGGRNERVGQGWTYARAGYGAVRVTPGGRSSFVLTRCE